MQYFQEQAATVQPHKTVFSDDAVNRVSAAPLRVLTVGPHPTRTLGGISTMIAGLLRAAPAASCEMRHIASQCDEARGIEKLTLAVRALRQFRWMVLRWHPTVTMIHVGSNASLYRKAIFIAVARWLGQRVITHFHAGDFEHYYGRQGLFGRRLIRSGLQRSHKLIAVSHAAAQRLRELVPDADIVMIPNGIKTQDFAPALRPHDGYVRLLFVGGMGKLKGERDLIRALQLAAASAPQLRVSLLGHGAESLRPLIHECGVQSRIEHLGPVPHADCPTFFRGADIFVLPSYGEGMPMSALEAMAAGLPVVATSVGGIPELITHCAEGFLISPGNIQDLAGRIVQLANDPKLRARMGQLALAKARQFDEQIVMTRLLKELRN
ncbi:MAG: glycosyltransferase family 4 protein [Blastocatellia bacterium]